RELLDAVEPLVPPVEPGRLETVEGLIVADVAREPAQVHEVPAHAGDAVERRPRPLGLHRDERRPARARSRRRRVDEPEPGAEDVGAPRDRRRLEERRDREVDAVPPPDAVEEAHGEDRLPAEVEEVVVHAHARDPEQLAPESGELVLDLVPWRYRDRRY